MFLGKNGQSYRKVLLSNYIQLIYLNYTPLLRWPVCRRRSHFTQFRTKCKHKAEAFFAADDTGRSRVDTDFCTNVLWCIQLIVLTEIQLVALLGRLHFLSDWQHPNFKNDKGKIKNVFTALHCLLWLHTWLLSTSRLDKKRCSWALMALLINRNGSKEY